MSALLLAAALAVSLHATDAAPLSIDAIETAIATKNPGLQAAWRSADKAKAEARAAAAWEDPELSYEWMQLRWPDPILSDAGRRRLELTQVLPLFGQAGARGNAGQHAAMRAAAEAQIERARLAFEAKSAFWSAQQATRMIKTQVRTQAALASMRQVSAQRGRFGRLDRMGQLMDAMLERELARDEAMALHWQAEQRAALFRLERLMGGEGDPENPLLPLVEPELAALLAPSWTAEELWDKAQRQSPELQEAWHHVSHAQAERSAVRRDWLPQLMLEGGLEESMGMNEASFKAGINLPWLWFWGQSGRDEAAGLELGHAQAMVQDTRLMLREQCRMLASDLYTSQAELKLSAEKVLPAAQRALEAAESGYHSGEISAREAMDAVMGYWQANEDYAHRLWHVGSTLAAIDRLMAAPAMEMSHE
jgi:cobalt-zinc-cadmium efflux system outer membrane protein